MLLSVIVTLPLTLLMEILGVLGIKSVTIDAVGESLLNLLQVENMHQETLRDYIDVVQRYYDAYLDMMHNVGHDILLQTDL